MDRHCAYPSVVTEHTRLPLTTEDPLQIQCSTVCSHSPSALRRVSSVSSKQFLFWALLLSPSWISSDPTGICFSVFLAGPFLLTGTLNAEGLHSLPYLHVTPGQSHVVPAFEMTSLAEGTIILHILSLYL